MTALPPQIIAILADVASPASVLDLNTGQPPAFYRGTDIAVGIGIAQNGAILPPGNAFMARIASVTCQVFLAENDGTPNQMSCNVLAAAMNLALTQQQWTNESAAAHAVFVFPNAQTAIAIPNGGASANLWLRIFATTSDATPQIWPLIEGPINIKDSPVTALSVPPLAGAKFMTVNGNLEFMILDRNTGLYHIATAVNVAGDEVWELSDQGY